MRDAYSESQFPATQTGLLDMNCSGRALACAALVAAVLCGCSTVNQMRPSTRQAQEHAQQAQVLQLKVMRFADEYAGREREAINTLQAGSQDPQERLLAQRWKVQQAESAYTIASGANAVTNALDMVVLATLSRMVLDDVWMTDLYGARARLVQETYHSLEASAWQLLSGVLDDSQTARLRAIIDEWRAQHPKVRSVAYIHFLDFAKSVGAPAEGEQQRPGNLFALVGLNPLSGLDPAVQQIALTRELAERSIYYLQRTPDLLHMQVELITYQSAVLPETQTVLSDISRFSLIGSASDRLVSTLPDMLDRQREALVQQLTQTLNAQSASLGALAEQVRAALQAGTDTANAVHGALETVDKITGRFARPPGADPAPRGPPFDIRHYTAMLEQAAFTAREINTLTQSADAMLPTLRSATQDAAAHLEAAENRLFVLLLLLVLAATTAALLAALAYRLIVMRFERRQAA